MGTARCRVLPGPSQSGLPPLRLRRDINYSSLDGFSTKGTSTSSDRPH